MKVIKMLKDNSELFQTSGKPRRMKTWANKKKKKRFTDRGLRRNRYTD